MRRKWPSPWLLGDDVVCPAVLVMLCAVSLKMPHTVSTVE